MPASLAGPITTHCGAMGCLSQGIWSATSTNLALEVAQQHQAPAAGSAHVAIMDARRSWGDERIAAAGEGG